MILVRALGIVAALLLAAPIVIGAPAAPAELAVIRVDEGLAYVDVGRKNGVAPGQALEVVTREGSDDAFHLGWIVLESCGETVSLAHVPSELVPYVKQGTLLRLPGAGTPRPPPTVPKPATAPPPTPPPAIATGSAAPPAETPPPVVHASAIAAFRHEPPVLVAPGVPLTLSVFAPAPLAAPTLMYRLAGEHAFAALPFKAQPDSYYTVAIPPARVQAPAIEYYIVVDAPDSPRRLAFATPEEPERIGVEGRFNETTELARYGVRDEMSLTSELVSYASVNGTHDYYYRAEGDYLHRIFGNIYSMRFGAGYLHGVAFDSSLNPTTVGFLYAYSEAEFRAASAPFAFIPRLIFGVNDQGVGGGFEARVRVGDELGMNFEGGVTVLSQLGFETFTTLTLHPLPRTSVALAAYLEDLPIATQLGFRSYADLRYRIARATSVGVRLGVAARSIDTIGPDLGLGVSYGF
ncbi:MAG TPA: hypothetical protein VGL61_19685 [Kofleriaceae bacterium]|jgi:hypothetical protein